MSLLVNRQKVLMFWTDYRAQSLGEIRQSTIPSVFLSDLNDGLHDEVSSEIDDLGYNQFHYSILQGNIQSVEYLISKNWSIDNPSSNDTKDPPIILSVESGDVHMLHCLIGNGADPNQCNLIGQNALIYAAATKKTLHVSYLLHIQHIDINAQDQDGYTALHYAVENGLSTMVKQLLSKGVDLKKINREGMTALHISAKNGNPLISRLILEKDPSLFHIEDNYRKTAYQYAFENYDADTFTILKCYKIRSFLPTPLQRKGDIAFPVITIFLIYIMFGFLPIYLAVLALALVIRPVSILLSEAFNSRKATIKVVIYCWSFVGVLQFSFIIVPNVSHKPFVILLFYIAFFVFVYSFMKANRTTTKYAYQRQSEILEIAGSIKENAPDLVSRFCTTCLAKRPLRSHHCYACNECIEKMDHHCPWINNCVGKKNWFWFYLTVVSTTVLGLLHFYLVYYCMFHEKEEGFLGKFIVARQLHRSFVEFWIGIIFLTIFCLILTIQHTYLIGVNLTSVENKHWWRNPIYIDEYGQFKNPFDRGFIGNFREVIADSFDSVIGSEKVI